MKKRLLAALLALTLMFSVTACEDMSEEDMMGLMAMFAMMGVDMETQVDYGTLEEGVYNNETLGFSFVLPEGWTAFTGDVLLDAMMEDADFEDAMMMQMIMSAFMQQLVIAYSSDVEDWDANTFGLQGIDEGKLPETGAFIMAYVINTEFIETLTGDDIIADMFDSIEEDENVSVIPLTDNSFVAYGWDMTEDYETPAFAALWVGIGNGQLIQILAVDTSGVDTDSLLAFIDSIEFSSAE